MAVSDSTSSPVQSARSPNGGRAASRHASGTTPATHTTEAAARRSPRSEAGSVACSACRSSRLPAAGRCPTVATAAGEGEIVGVGADLAPGTLLAAYRQGLFPMRLQAADPSASDRSGGGRRIPAGSSRSTGCIVSRSLRRSVAALRGARRHRVRGGDARVRRPASTARLDRQEVHRRVHRAAPARLGAQRRDVAGDDARRDGARRWPLRREHRRPVRGRVEVPPRHRRVQGRASSRSSTCCATGGGTLLDVQWTTPHLASLGAVDVSRGRYAELVADAVARPPCRRSPTRPLGCATAER